MHLRSTALAIFACVSVSACHLEPFKAAPANKWDGRYSGTAETVAMGGYYCNSYQGKVYYDVLDNTITAANNNMKIKSTIDYYGNISGGSSDVDISGQITDKQLEMVVMAGNCLFKKHLIYVGATPHPTTSSTTTDRSAANKLATLKTYSTKGW